MSNARLVSLPWHILGKGGGPCVETARQLWGGDVSWRTATTYDAAQALISAMATEASRDGVYQTLSRSGFEVMGAARLVRFFSNGDRNQAAQLVYIAPGERSGFGYDYVPVADVPVGGG